MQNLSRLLEIPDDSDGTRRIRKSEIFRELGRHDKAADLLAYNFPQNILKMVAALKSLNNAANRNVVALKLA